MPGAICLDLTRLLSRAGRGPDTGIDRVERGYLEELLCRDLELSALLRTADGFAWLNSKQIGHFATLSRDDGPWTAVDTFGRLSRRLPSMRRHAEAQVRGLAEDRAWRTGLPRLVRRHLVPDSVYLNVGHSNLDARVLAAMRGAGARVAVFVHDTIPLELPETQRPGTELGVRARLEAADRYATHVIAPSYAAMKGLREHFPGMLAHPVVCPPGVAIPEPDASELPADIDPSAPFFVALGTIDARKNQRILIEAWRQMGMDVPPLYLVGTPGYLGTALEAELASMPANVRILSGVSDGGVAALLQHAVALLHPSRAEGFGYPPLEASAFGCPLILSDLPVFRETVGDNPVYVNPDDLYGWTKAVHAVLSRHGQRKRGEQSAGIRLPTWVAHLNHVLSMVWEEHDGENGAGARRGHG